MATKSITHDKAAEYAACRLIENGIPTKDSYTKGSDLVLDNGKTILVRGLSGYVRAFLINGSIDTLKSDYIVIVTGMKHAKRHIHVLKIEDAKRLAFNKPCKRDMCDDWFINAGDYKYYKDDYIAIGK